MVREEIGFTLIELLVVVAIIGILAAIAIPQFEQYRLRAFDKRAMSDLRNAISAQEAYFADNEIYVTCTDSACIGTLPGFARSADVRIEQTHNSSTASFIIYACHPSGEKSYRFQSTTGQTTEHTLVNRDCSDYGLSLAGLSYS